MEFSSLYISNIKIFQHSNPVPFSYITTYPQIGGQSNSTDAKKFIVRLQNNNLGEFKKDDKPGFVHHELDKCHAMIWH